METAAWLEPAKPWRAVARKVCWWQTPARTLADPTLFLNYAMAHAGWEEARLLREKVPRAILKRALRLAPAGLYDGPTWHYWHVVCGTLTGVPPRPVRAIPGAAGVLPNGRHDWHEELGHRFNPLLCLKALVYFEEPSLKRLPGKIRKTLLEAVGKLEALPVIRASSVTVD